mgnify:CR=1 FL=1
MPKLFRGYRSHAEMKLPSVTMKSLGVRSLQEPDLGTEKTRELFHDAIVQGLDVGARYRCQAAGSRLGE